jgi:Domain of unknown function (DUF5615)
MAVADRENRILIPADTDFGELLATAPIIAPSLIILRRTDRRPDSRASIILANLAVTWPVVRHVHAEPKALGRVTPLIRRGRLGDEALRSAYAASEGFQVRLRESRIGPSMTRRSASGTPSR